MNGSRQATTTGTVLLTVIVVVAVLRLAQDLFVPLAIAILLTFLLAPIVVRLKRWHINRVIAVFVSIALALGLIGLVGAVIFGQLSDLAHQLPQYEMQLRQHITHLRGFMRGGITDSLNGLDRLTAQIESLSPLSRVPVYVQKVQVVQAPASLLELLRELIGPLVKPLGWGFAVMVLVAFMLLRLPDLRERVIRLLGPRNLHATTSALDDAAARVSRYLLSQLLINSLTGLWVGVGLSFLGVPNPGLWGALTLVLRFIPYIGVWSAGVVPLALSFAAFDDWMHPLIVVGIYGSIELFNYAVLEPWLYSAKTGVSSVALLLATAFWTWLWGVPGLLLSVPITVCVVVMGKYVPQLEFLEVLLGDEPALEPYQRLYQRLLTSNRDEADVVLEQTLREHSLREVCDIAIVPALRLLEADFVRGSLKPARRRAILDHIQQWVDELLEEMQRTDGRGVSWQAPSILCLPAEDQADAIIAKLLAAVLINQGISTRVGTLDRLDEEISTSTESLEAVVISALPPDAVPPARAVVKRVRARAEGVPVIVGIWGLDHDLDRAGQRLGSVGVSLFQTRVTDCVERIERLRRAPEPSQEEASPTLVHGT
ncbi:MAG TPA: AI-2E family transporter [Steroidobacteraceae bacterium]|jgi:predicted PurR-regulated permease PerM|nr:AI-2E family transporter [Steroidobacteraceae bacterium]